VLRIGDGSALVRFGTSRKVAFDAYDPAVGTKHVAYEVPSGPVTISLNTQVEEV
jgi:hypothetical protein